MAEAQTRVDAANKLGADLAITACCCTGAGGLACAGGAAPKNAVRAGALVAERRRDRAQLGEQVVQPPPLDLGRRPH